MAIEIVDFPMKIAWWFSIAMLVYQRVFLSIHSPCPWNPQVSSGLMSPFCLGRPPSTRSVAWGGSFSWFFFKVGTVGIFISHKMGVQSMGYEDWYMGYSYPISAKYGFSLEFKTIMKQWVCKTLAKLRVLRYPSSNPRRTSHRPWIQEPQAMVSSRAVCLLFEIGLVHPRVCCWSKWLTVQSTTICSVQNHFQIHIAVHFFPLKSSSSNPNVHFSNPSFCWFNPHFRYLNHLQPVKPPFFILKPTIFHTSTVLNPPFFPWFNRRMSAGFFRRAPARNPASPPSQPSAGPRKWRLRCRCWPRSREVWWWVPSGELT